MLLVKPTLVIPRNLPAPPRLALSIGVQIADGYEPISWYRGSSVGVGGKHMGDPLGLREDAVRAATRNEMRRLARLRIADYLAQYPDGVVTVQRVRG